MELGGLTTIPRYRTALWGALVALLAALAYVGNATAEDDPAREPLFEWRTAVGGAIVALVLLALTAALAIRVDRGVLGFRRPRSWRSATGLMAAGFVAVFAIGGVVEAAGLDPGAEQGLVPDGVDRAQLAPFLANCVVVAVLAPVAEETLFRAFGYAAVSQLAGVAAAVIVTGIAFGLVHGFVIALPVLASFGIVLAVIRARTGSVYPCMILHGVFNSVALALGALGVGS